MHDIRGGSLTAVSTLKNMTQKSLQYFTDFRRNLKTVSKTGTTYYFKVILR